MSCYYERSDLMLAFIIGYMPDEYAERVVEIGGRIVRRWGGKMDVQFDNHSLYVNGDCLLIVNRYDSNKQLEVERKSAVGCQIHLIKGAIWENDN